MAENLALATFPRFDTTTEPSSIGPRWKKWMMRLNNRLTAMAITDPNRKLALLLDYAGDDVHDDYLTLTVPPEVAVQDGAAPPADNDIFSRSVTALNNHYSPKVQREYEIFNFREAAQNEDETLDQYVTRLRKLGATCDFQDLSAEIKSQIIQKGKSTKLRTKALTDLTITLHELITVGKAMERANEYTKGIEKKDETVNRISASRGRPQHRGNYRGNSNQQNRGSGNYRGNSRGRHQGQKNQGGSTTKTGNTECGLCGGNYPHDGGREKCPAFNSTCHNCGIIGHYAKKCRKDPENRPDNRSDNRSSNYRGRRGRGGHRGRQVHNIETHQNYDDQEEDFVFTVNSERNSDKPFFSVKINGTPVKMLGDSGAPVNIIDEMALQKLSPPPDLQNPDMSLFPYGPKDKPLELLGMFAAKLTSGEKTDHAKIYVAKGNHGALLGKRSAENLELIKINQEALVANVGSSTDTTTIIAEFKDLFGGLGKLKDHQVKLHIDPDIQPVTQPHRRIPFHLRQKVEEEIKRLEDLDVIEIVDGPTPWVSPIVAAPKPKDPTAVRLCVDMRMANSAISRERHLTPTIDDIIHDLNGAAVFSKLDLNSGYYQLELHPDSRYITTFTTHLGLRRYKRLNFGISSAAEVFQNVIQTSLEGLNGVRNISDDIIVYGATQAEHDTNLKAVLTRLRERNLTLNEKKCEFNQPKLEFYGHIFSKDGMSVDPKKVEAITHLKTPENPTDLRSLLGMANYSAKFIPNYATITDPLRRLTHQDVPWSWTTEHDNALRDLNHQLTSNRVLAYFDPRKQSTIYVDASPVGLGAMLSQSDGNHQKIISYASKALNDVEQRYSQTEREALAIVWACEHYHLYVFGGEVTVVTDHKPLLGIFNNPRSRTSARLERWALRLIPYQMNLTYQKGKLNPADYMSRNPDNSSTTTSRATKIAEEYVNFITDEARPLAISMEEIVTATARDASIQIVVDSLKTNRWPASNADIIVQAYQKISDQLSVSSSGVLLRGSRICIPTDLQKRTIDLAHEGHQGITKTKALLREKVWFPKIDDLVEEAIKTCLPCQTTTPKTTREPLQMTNADRAWEEVSMDFAEVEGKYLLIIVDDFTRYPEVEIISSLTASTVIPKIESVFARWGIPKVVKTDNGPPFNSKNFAEYAKISGFKHRKITPLWPEANGEAERFVRTIKKTISAAKIEHRNWQYEMWTFLRNYRATPHSSTKISPATVMTGREIRTRLPQNTRGKPTEVEKQVKKNDEKAKQQMKEYADHRRNTQESTMKIGDNVIILQKGFKNKFNPDLYKVLNKKGSQVTAKRGDHIIVRNSSFFKVIPPAVQDIRRTPEEYEVDFEDMRMPARPQAVAPPQRQQPQEVVVPQQQQPIPERERPVREKRVPTYLRDFVR